jgi:hypothetical protein
MCDSSLVITPFITTKEVNVKLSNEITYFVITGSVLIKPHLSCIFVGQVNNLDSCNIFPEVCDCVKGVESTVT